MYSQFLFDVVREMKTESCRRQMRGRAGRKGKDEIGEAYLCCEKRDLETVAELLEGEMPSIGSCLMPEKRGIKRSKLLYPSPLECN